MAYQPTSYVFKFGAGDIGTTQKTVWTSTGLAPVP